jgi:ribose transport system substrate-binding protein
MLTRILQSIIAFGLIVSLSACGGGQKKTRLAFISNNPEDFWAIAEKGTDKAEAELGVVVDFERPQDASVERQQSIIEDLMAKGVKGIAISPNDSKNLVPFLRDNTLGKVELITVDSDVPDPKVRRCYLGTHNYRAGRAVGELVEKAVPEGGKIVIFVGKMDVQNAVERRQGVLDYLRGKKTKNDEMEETDPPDATNIKVGKYVLLDTKTDSVKANICQQRAEEVLVKSPDVVCFVGLWAYNPPALLRAVQASKNDKKPIIVGFDEDYETLDGIRSGAIAGTVVQDPFNFGYESIKLLAAMVKGEDPLKGRKDVDDQNRIFIPHRVITKGNVDEFQAELKKLTGK